MSVFCILNRSDRWLVMYRTVGYTNDNIKLVFGYHRGGETYATSTI